MIRVPRSFPAALVASLAAIGPVFPSGAGQMVTLSNGSRMEAEAVASDGRRVKITLSGGGEIWLPQDRVARVEQFQTTPSAPGPGPVTGVAPSETPGSPGGGAGRSAEAPHFSPTNPEPSIRNLIAYLASPAGVDARLVEAMVKVESNFDPYAVSRRGAMGLMQLMPQTASRYEVSRPFEPEQNLRAGIAYLKDLLDRYGKLELALAAYNAGEKAVDRHGGIPPYRETRDYVRRILGILQS